LKSLLIVAAVPTLYAGLGSAITRRIGFSPFVLAAGWLSVEFLVALTTTSDGILQVPFTESAVLNWLAHSLGTVFVGFVSALAAGTFVAIANRVCSSVDHARPRISSEIRRTIFSPLFAVVVRGLHSPRQSRAPPVQSLVS